jgi:alginate O-acetyltransferase complex protein AlgI
MLFNSYEFIFFFFPVTVYIFHLIGKQGHSQIAITWLVGASLFFYGWWNPAYLWLIVFSIVFNYRAGVSLGRPHNGPKPRLILIFSIMFNLTLLGYFKYVNFFIENINLLTNSNIFFSQIILPLAISFFTFQQITYLVDAFRGEIQGYNFLHYCLFVTFFPQLIAGPIVHHKEMLPQFLRNINCRIREEHLAAGMTIFAIGLFKKVVLADGIAVYATPIFDLAELGVVMTLFEAWGGALAYTFQLYFDFSGYSDMAIGLARMFGVRLPLNFNSPYKATSINEFWSRWHITLSRFLRDYLYIPLGGNRKGGGRHLANLMITTLIGGVWHGAGWTFVLWGGLQGVYLVINHGWHKICRTGRKSKLSSFFGWAVTMLAVVVSWVPFRADSLDGAKNILVTMFFGHGISLPSKLSGKIGNFEPWFIEHGVIFDGTLHNGFFPVEGIFWILVLLLVSIALPNTQQIMLETHKNETPELRYQWMIWKPSLAWVIITAGILLISVLSLSKASEFLYFQF